MLRVEYHQSEFFSHFYFSKQKKSCSIKDITFSWVFLLLHNCRIWFTVSSIALRLISILDCGLPAIFNCYYVYIIYFTCDTNLRRAAGGRKLVLLDSCGPISALEQSGQLAFYKLNSEKFIKHKNKENISKLQSIQHNTNNKHAVKKKYQKSSKLLLHLDFVWASCIKVVGSSKGCTNPVKEGMSDRLITILHLPLDHTKLWPGHLGMDLAEPVLNSDKPANSCLQSSWQDQLYQDLDQTFPWVSLLIWS